MNTPTLKQIECALGEKASTWKGRCFEIASSIVAKGLVDGTAVYGHWLGPVHKRSIFYGHSGGFVQHGWIVLKNDPRVLDPTRWAFEAKRPYLFLGLPGQYYDEGGNKLRARLRPPPPEWDSEEKQYYMDHDVLPTPAWNWMEKILHLDNHFDEDGYEPGKVTISQLLWLATSPLEDLNLYAADIYAALEKLKLTALIPVDNYRRVKEGRWI